MVASIGLYVATLAGSGSNIGMGGIGSLLAPSPEMLFRFGASGAIPVFDYDRWWTIFSAGWLHGGLLHIFFNLMWVRQLAPETAELYGPGRTVIIYTISGAAGFALSSVMGHVLPGVPLLGGAGFTVGASAPIFGLLGALVCYGRRTGSSHIGGTAWQYAVVLFVFGLFMNAVDNYAHAGGFVGGYGAALLLDPSKRERVDHLMGALACLIITVGAVAVSLITSFGLF
jgi:membrane associated rhomboid family serine protease